MVFFITPWVVVIIRNKRRKKKLALPPVQLVETVVRSYLWAFVILGIASKLSYLEERHWVAKDELGARSGIFLTKAHALVFESLKKETETLLGPRPSTIDPN